MQKKLVSFAVAACLAVGSISNVSAFAMNEPAKAAAQVSSEKSSLSTEKLTELASKMKKLFKIPEDFSKFSYDYYQDYDEGTWHFYWNAEDGRYIMVECDDNARVSYYSYSADTESKALPSYSKKTAEKAARNYVKEISPLIADKLELVESEMSIWDGSYNFQFQRVENGVPMPSNTVEISVDYTDKSLRSYRIEWYYDVKLPDAKNIITKEEATKKIASNVDMKLSYRLKWTEEGKLDTYLAYSPSKGYLAVDAHSGKVYDKRIGWDDNDYDTEEATAEEKVRAVDDDDDYGLSAGELAEIDKVKGIIPSEAIIESLKKNKSLYFPETITSSSANFYHNNEDVFYWDIGGVDERPVEDDESDSFRAYYSAKVNAKTGEILSFYASIKEPYDYTEDEIKGVKRKYSQKQCQKVFEDFVREQNAEQFAQAKLDSAEKKLFVYDGDDDTKGRPLASGFTYGRYYKDIPVQGNYYTGEVDGVTGKIYVYNVQWSDTTFKNPAKTISAEEAFKKYLGCRGYDLIYETYQNYEETEEEDHYKPEYKVRLVYRTEISPAIIDAFTGKQLYYNGEEYVPEARNYAYTDIAKSKYRDDIELLAELGVGLEGKKFYPDKAITRGEFLTLLKVMPVGNYYYIVRGIEDFDEQEKLLKDTRQLTRKQAAKYMAETFGCGKFMQLDIFKTGFVDESKLSKNYLPAVAIVSGLGIMKGYKNGCFKPGKKVTRGEAAAMLIRMLKADID